MPVQLRDCSFSYNKKVPVLTELTLGFEEGSTVLLGPNGAGKSTVLGLAASALRARSGQVGLAGGPSVGSRRETNEYRRRVGWLPQQVQPVRGLRVREQVAYAGWLKGMSRSAAWEGSRAALECVSLTALADRRSHELSGGQLRRLGIAQTLVHSAEVVLMDEPTAGLDPQQRTAFRDLIEHLREQVHFVISTHQTEDLADTYDEVVVLDRGVVRFQGAVTEFLGTAGPGSPTELRAADAYSRLVQAEV
jgi:ABC-2 type transport system ATP-binding protein